MELTQAQQRVVEENLGLVGKVLKDKVRGIGQEINFTYEDLFQIGCIGLCKAAATDKGGTFSTYAYRLIWNEICDALIKASRVRQREQTMAPEDLQSVLRNNVPMDLMDACEQEILMEQVRLRATGVQAKGILCLELAANGYSSKEIGEMLDTKPATVRMWMTKGRRFLMEQPEFQNHMMEVNA